MQTRIRKYLVISVSALALGVALTLPARSEVVENLGIILVTPSLTPIAASQTGSTVSVITGDQIEDRGVAFTSDILRTVPGLSVNRTGSFGGLTQVRLRGTEANHVVVLIDGIEANDVISGSEFDFGSLLSGQIERIEVLRGPQSALYGSDAIGGVISVTTKTSKEKATAHASVEGGSFGTYLASAGLGFGYDAFRLDLSAQALESEGTNISRFGSERDGHSNTTFNGKFSARPSDQIEISTVMRYTNTSSEFDPQDFTFGSPTNGLVIDGDRETARALFYYKGEARIKLFDERWINSLRISGTDSEVDNSASGARTDGTMAARHKYAFQSDATFGSVEKDGASHGVSVLVEREEESFRNDPDPAFFFVPADLAAARRKHRTRQNSVAAEYRLNVFDTFFATAGVRYDDNDRFKDATTYRLTGAFNIAATGTRLHGSYGTGVKNPSFFELFGFNPNQFVGNASLTPEMSKGFDFGVEQRLFGDRVKLDVTYYQSRLQDEINGFVVISFAPFLATAQNLPGKSKRHGIEVSLSAQILDNLFFSGAYTYARSEQPDGTEEVRRPRHIASASATYRFLDDRATIALGVDYNGRQKDNFFGTFPATPVTLKDFTLVSVKGAMKVTGNLSVFGRVENLLDENYEEVFSFTSPGIAAYGGAKIMF